MFPKSVTLPLLIILMLFFLKSGKKKLTISGSSWKSNTSSGSFLSSRPAEGDVMRTRRNQFFHETQKCPLLGRPGPRPLAGRRGTAMAFCGWPAAPATRAEGHSRGTCHSSPTCPPCPLATGRLHVPTSEPSGGGGRVCGVESRFLPPHGPSPAASQLLPRPQSTRAV